MIGNSLQPTLNLVKRPIDVRREFFLKKNPRLVVEEKYRLLDKLDEERLETLSPEEITRHRGDVFRKVVIETFAITADSTGTVGRALLAEIKELEKKLEVKRTGREDPAAKSPMDEFIPAEEDPIQLALDRAAGLSTGKPMGRRDLMLGWGPAAKRTIVERAEWLVPWPLRPFVSFAKFVSGG